MSTDDKWEVLYMEDEELEQNETAEENEGAGKADTQTANSNKNEGKSDNGETVEEKAQKLADGMLKKKMKGMPSKEELKAFKEWQETQKTDEQKKSEQEIEYQKTLAEKEDLAKENLVFKKGVSNADDVEFLVYKISKMDGDFEDNLDEFLKEHPNYLKIQQEDKQEDAEQEKETTGVKVNNGSVKPTNGVDAILKNRHPELFKD